jgi:hypothetical protein
MGKNGFKLIGTLYISKQGNNGNAGTDPNQPKASIQLNPANGIQILGAGVYDAVALGTNFGYIYGDGAVTIRPAAPTGVFAMGGGNMHFYNIVLERCDIGVNQTTSQTMVVYNSVIKGCTGMNGSVANNRKRQTQNCVIIDSNLGVTGAFTFNVGGCVVINSTLKVASNTMGFTNNYLDFNSKLQQVGTTIIPSQFYCNNIQGQIYMAPTWYAVQDQFVGTPQDNGYPAGVQWLNEANLTANGYVGLIAGWDACVATWINRDPQFLDAANGVYFNGPNSPNNYRGTTGYGNIGLNFNYEAFINSDNGDGRGTVVIPSAEIDTTDPANFKLLSGQVQGYVDYVCNCRGKRLRALKVRSLYEYNAATTITPGTPGNQLVPDSQPLTADYPLLAITTMAAPDNTHVVVPQGLISVGQWVMCGGRQTQVISKVNSPPNDIIELSGPQVIVIPVSIAVTYGTLDQIAALVPNRLTYLMRSKSTAPAPTIPFVDAEWDNGVDPGLGLAGTLINNEVLDNLNYPTPGIIVGDGVLYGVSDVNAPVIPPRSLAPQWLHVRVYIRNNYKAIGQ